MKNEKEIFNLSKRGDAAREAAKNTIIEAFGTNFVCCADKKIYVEVQDGPGGETIQLAISMTIPKTALARSEESQTSVPANDWSGPVASNSAAQSSEITEDDKAKVKELMKKLGLE